MNRRLAIVLAGSGGALVVASVAAVLIMGGGEAGADGGAADTADAGTSQDQGFAKLLSQADFTEEELLLDHDADGLADVIENFVYGSDPQAWSTTGDGVPDGWYAKYGYDPTIPGNAFRPAATPDPSQLPPAYGGLWDYGWTLKDVYEWGMPADAGEDAEGSVWDNGIDPRKASYSPDGIPYAWLHHHGFAPDGFDAGIESSRLTSDDFTVMDNFIHDTDPQQVDTDADGLTDSEEIQPYGTDPRRFSTSRTGIPDGWLVLHGMDPADVNIGSKQTTGKGMTVQETWEYNLDTFGLDIARSGFGIDPAAISTLDQEVPDGWLIQHGLDPLDAGLLDEETQRASDFDHVRNLTVSPPDHDPIPDLVLTIREQYLHGRPASWDEATHGVWSNNLDPAAGDADGDGLPDAIEIRGWYVSVATAVGPAAEEEWRFVTSDPLRADTDGDDLTDAQEYFGRILNEEDALVVFAPTDPRNQDTAFSGISDGDKVFGLGQWVSLEDPDSVADLPIPGALEGSSAPDTLVRPVLDPTRRDTSGSYLGDGGELDFWLQYQEHFDAGVGDYGGRFPDSGCIDWATWAMSAPGADASPSAQELHSMLGPWGDVDDDGAPNIADSDADGDGLRNGWEIQPALYKHSRFQVTGTGLARPATDPANSGTDCTGLPDGWQVEHARQGPTGWTLDPSKQDSDGDGELDWEENLDGDVVTWHRYEGGQKFAPEFSYYNLLEFEQGTDPNVKDENEDGVSEGWVYFWDQQYEQLVDADKAGDIVPDADTIASLGPFAGDQTKELDEHDGEIPYRRVIPGVQNVQDIASFTKEGETIDDDAESSDTGENPGKTRVFEGGATVEKWRGVVRGTYDHTHAMDQAHGLNPYLADTDGDGLPDSWETLFGKGAGILDGCEGMSPVEQDASDDAAGGQMTNMEAYRDRILVGSTTFWSDPCKEDTDLDGVEDHIEISLGTNNMDPTDPFDVTAAFGNSNTDTDADGRPDKEELDEGTDPTNPDTDLDGLLDAASRTLTPGQHDDLIEDWKSRGITHKVESDGKIQFLGESDVKTDDTDPYSLVEEGVPDGWLIHYGHVSTPSDSKVTALRDAYECNRPDWWDESDMGVWWWGANPGSDQFPCVADMDRDGLDDTNSEDPTPAGNRASQTVDVHPLDVLGDPEANHADVLKAAQGLNECAGSPKTCQSGWKAFNPASGQAPVHVRLDDPLPDTVHKMVPFTVSGDVCLGDDDSGSCIGVPNRTVTVQLDDPDETTGSLGVGFTDAQGHFQIGSCVCPTRSANIPHDGMVANGKDAGTVDWTVPADGIDIGNHDLMVRVYATTAVLAATDDTDHPHFIDETLDSTQYHATKAHTTTPQSVDVASTTQLTMESPPSVGWSATNRGLTAQVTLLDAAGGFLAGESVVVELLDGDGGSIGTGRTETDITDDNGMATAQFSHGDLSGRVGEHRLRATFAGDPGLLEANNTMIPADVVLQAPVTLQLNIEDAPSYRSGEDIKVTATVTSLGDPFPDVTVDFTLAGTRMSDATDENGHAELHLPLDGLVADEYTITAEVASSIHFSGAKATDTIEVVSGSILQSTLPRSVEHGGAIDINGLLTLPDGTGLQGKTLMLKVGGETIQQVTTGPGGAFSETAILPETIGPGLWTMRLTYDGDGGSIDGDESSTMLRIFIPSKLTLQDGQAERGEQTQFTGTLTDATGRPLRGERVQVHVGDHDAGHAITGRQGQYSIEWTVLDDLEHGNQSLRAMYDGSRNDTYAPTDTHARLLVPTATTLSVSELGDVGRQEYTIQGELLSKDGDAVPDAELAILMDDAPVAVQRTGPDGGYEHVLQFGPDARPGSFNLTVLYAGNQTYGAAMASSGGTLIVQPVLSLHAPEDAGRGGTTDLRSILLDDQGAPVANASIQFQMQGTEDITVTDGAGVATIRWGFAPDLPLGTTPIDARFTGMTGYLPASDSKEIIIKESARILIDPLPTQVRPDEPIEVRVHLSDGHGNPMVGEAVAIRFEGDPLFTVATTDSNGTANATMAAPPLETTRLQVRYAGDETYASVTGASDPITLMQATMTPTMPGPSWLPLATAAVGLAIVTAGVWMWVRMRRPQALLEALRRAETGIGSGEPWKQAIRDAYQELVRVTSLHGHGESDAESVREFMQSLASVAPIPAGAAVELTRLFEQATYSKGPGGKTGAPAAQQSLQRIIGAIEAFLKSGAPRRTYR